jgi:mono/diheme cytochrome c family protein
MTRKPALLMTIVVAMVMVMTLVAACGDGGTGTKDAPKTAGDVAAGQAVFQQHCNACHPGGGQGAGPALRGRNIAEDRIRTVVRQGASGMPAFNANQINDQQLTNLVQYVRSLQ